MKNVKRLLAVIGILFLVSLYIITLICAITDQSGAMRLFFASVFATILIPALIWAYSFIYRLLKKHYGSAAEEDASDSGSAQ